MDPDSRFTYVSFSNRYQILPHQAPKGVTSLRLRTDKLQTPPPVPAPYPLLLRQRGLVILHNTWREGGREGKIRRRLPGCEPRTTAELPRNPFQAGQWAAVEHDLQRTPHYKLYLKCSELRAVVRSMLQPRRTWTKKERKKGPTATIDGESPIEGALAARESRPQGTAGRQAGRQARVRSRRTAHSSPFSMYVLVSN